MSIDTRREAHDLMDEEEEQSTGGEPQSIADLQVTPPHPKGVLTPAYRADAQRVIDRLNQLRSTEIVSYLQYKQHAYMAVSLLGPGVKAEFVEHADEELKHADMLAERISQLGGVPLYDLCQMAEEAGRHQIHPEQGVTLEQMVMADLAVERAQVEAYRSFIQEIGNDDPVTRRMLEDILIDTEHHASELRDMLQHRA